MNQTKPFTILLFAILLINACSKDCTTTTINKYVDQSYLPYIIPYSDTSTRLFLKNGTDTLLFKSQGLKETVNDYYNTFRCEAFKLQQYSLKMAASDSDYFQINYYSRWQGISMVNFSLVNGQEFIITDEYQFASDNFKSYIYQLPIIKVNVLNNNYDSVRILKPFSNLTICMKPIIGILKIETLNNKYELIK